MSGATLIVPCYNEANRLDAGALLTLVDTRPGVDLLLVDDGSKDDTEALLLATAAQRPARVRVLSLPVNRGKAEAVRQGMLAAFGDGPAGGAQIAGYADADLSTPVPELLRLLDIIEARPDMQVVMGARIALLGNHIERSAVRHYLGRVFATAASLLLNLRVYDTQCGAKLFRRSPALLGALQTPFLSRWAFDVELLGRLLIGTPGVPPLPVSAVLEVPLGAWRDVPGSKLRPAAMAIVLSDLARIGVDFRRRRQLAR